MNAKIPTPLPLEKWAEFPHLRPRPTLQKEMAVREEDLARFWSRVQKGAENECWEWIGTMRGTRGTNKGYGSMKIFYHDVYAHRLSLYLHGIEIPNGLHVLHRCDNPTCVNPNHLFLGTNHENVLDSVRKGRRNHARGTRIAQSKLTPEMVLEIIRLVKSGSSVTKLARQFGLVTSTIYSITTGKTWRHLTGFLKAKEGTP